MRWPSEESLVTICQAVQFGISPQCTFAGAHLKVDQTPDSCWVAANAVEEHATEDDRRLFLALRHAIYVHCYARHFTGVLPPLSPVYDPAFVPDERLAEQLSAANQSRSRWDPGWEVCLIGNQGEIQVRNGDRYRNVPAGQYAYTAAPGMAPQVGDQVSLQALRESFQLQAGMYFAFGETLGDQLEQFDSVRFYFHLNPRDVPRLVKHLTGTFNRYQIPFQFKCQKYRENYDRVDAAVLYVARRFSDLVYRLVMEFATANEQQFRDEVPLLTKRIHPGIGVADDPVGELSFGQDRCDMITLALIESRRDARADPPAFFAALQRRFTARGLSWERPYLNPGRVEMFDASCESEGRS